VRVAFISVAIWWAVFTLPLLLFVRERQAPSAFSPGQALLAGVREIGTTLAHIRRYRALVLFLVAFWLYIDGVNTVIKMAVDYGLSIGLPTKSLITALLITQFVGFPAALAFGWIGKRWGTKLGLLIAIGVYFATTIWAYWLDTDTEFYAMAFVVGLVQGGVQSLSRSFYGRLVPADKAGEFFGFFNLIGKFAAIVGPLLMGGVALVTGSPRVAIVSLVVLFAAGGALLWRVPESEATVAGG
jgi:UMF1 family MFS transporter